jgi:glutamate formiminotransferase/formiminotetrahydrofolate cyclodeaminase
MKQSVIECIANYSEGRRPEVVQAIAEAIESIPNVHILDRHSDRDHNRSVITFVGPAEEIEEAAFRSIAKAAALINLDEQRGEHPRIGATDVVPFVPISGASMQDCVQLARRLGQRVGQELDIPVYLYEEAATRPERTNLENIRRGEYEALKHEILVDPQRQPDFGPSRLGPAGATVIGARQPLIAFNVYLNTDDINVAKKIARAIRHSSGGLRYVKALEMPVEGRAQVSMNLTNFRLTPLARVVEMIRSEASRYGTAIHHSELVGLIPQQALVDAAVWYLQLDQFVPEQVLETRLSQARQSQTETPESPPSSTLNREDFLEALSAGTAAPGGGSAAAYAGAMAAALVGMVARLTVGKKKYVEVETQMLATAEQADALRGKALRAVEQDALAYTQVMQAFKLPKASPEEQQARTAAIEQATLGAIQVPLETAQLAVQTLELAHQVICQGNLNAISDGGSGAALARASLNGAALNVRINAAAIQDNPTAQDAVESVIRLEAQAAQLEQAIQQSLLSRSGLAAG